MIENYIHEISEKVLGEKPIRISRKTIGICNEVFELEFPSDSYIIRLNKQKNLLYGTHKFLPLFKELAIPTPDIVGEDYSMAQFPYCYQILTKIEGKDLVLVIDQLSESELKQVAAEVSSIFDKFHSLPPKNDFGGLSGMHEESYGSMWEVVKNQVGGIKEANEPSHVLDEEALEILEEITQEHKSYFQQVIPRLYYDDISGKNIMIHQGEFVGLVDLDFLRKGDYLVALGAIMACWHGEAYGDIYLNEIIRLQGLNEQQQNMIRLYAIIHLFPCGLPKKEEPSTAILAG